MVALGWFDFTGEALFIAAFVAGFFVLGGQGAVNSLPALVYPDHLRATGAGWAVGTGRCGSVIGPALAGMLLAANWHSSQVLMVAAIAPATAACLLTMLAFKSRTPSARAGAQKWA
jgi:AAHS family 4-hydroxybenzoate transporter-like MFS transporter